MAKWLKITLITAFALICCVGGGYGGYITAINSKPNQEFNTSAVATSNSKDTIGENTVLEFVYNYSDGYSETQQSLPQQFMYGWDREKTIRNYSDWQVSEFGSDRVVFNKSVEGNSSQHYILKINKDYVAVYYRDTGILKEITSTPVKSLSEEDRKAFEIGVEIEGEDNLIRYMEALES